MLWPEYLRVPRPGPLYFSKEPGTRKGLAASLVPDPFMDGDYMLRFAKVAACAAISSVVLWGGLSLMEPRVDACIHPGKTLSFRSRPAHSAA